VSWWTRTAVTVSGWSLPVLVSAQRADAMGTQILAAIVDAGGEAAPSAAGVHRPVRRGLPPNGSEDLTGSGRPG